ncbi:hypothetical protein BJ742DRAFT_890082 [Cladochytrium replicatum]|nr:hypothetical protein BJ742DRAFT_890082 [Cladochytrium replicatum]
MEEIEPGSHVLAATTLNHILRSVADRNAVSATTADAASTGVLIDVSSTASIADVLELMAKHDILAVPVYNPAGTHADEGPMSIRVGDKEYVSVVSILDIALYMMDYVDTSLSSDVLVGPGGQPSTALEGISIAAVLGGSREGQRLWVAGGNSTLQDALPQLTGGVHRLLVPIGKAHRHHNQNVDYRICSQVDVVRFLYDKIDSDLVLKEKAESSLSELGLINSEKTLTGLVAVDKSWSCQTTIRFMASSEIYAVAVVDESQAGKLVATLSLSDLRAAYKPDASTSSPEGDSPITVKALIPVILRNAFVTVEDFLKSAHGVKDIWELHSGLVVCRRTDTLRHVMRILVGEGSGRLVHRVWVMDEDTGVPVDVVSLTDVIRVLAFPRSEKEV